MQFQNGNCEVGLGGSLGNQVVLAPAPCKSARSGARGTIRDRHNTIAFASCKLGVRSATLPINFQFWGSGKTQHCRYSDPG